MKAYDYWWGYTAAQIDLMAIDQPMVSYKKRDRRNADGSKKHTLKEMDDLYDRWAARKEKEGSVVGQTINLKDYLNNKV